MKKKEENHKKIEKYNTKSDKYSFIMTDPYLQLPAIHHQDQRTLKTPQKILMPTSMGNATHKTLEVPNKLQINTNGQTSSKIDPSYKSKRYRDKLRSEIKELELLLPVDRSTLHRKLDSQTVFRLVIAFFRTKMFLKAAGLASQRLLTSGVKNENKNPDSPQKEEGNHVTEVVPPDTVEGTDILGGNSLLQILDGFLFVLTADGTILYVSRNITQSLGFNQVDLMHRCIYGIVHPDDHHELKVALETSLTADVLNVNKQSRLCCRQQDAQNATCRSVSFLIRIKCFNGTTTGYLKMHCSGHMRHLAGTVKSTSRTSSHVLFALCRPFVSTLTSDPDMETRSMGFWSKHDLDLSFKYIDPKVPEVLGCSVEDLEGRSFYQLVHPEDLSIFTACHKTLIRTEEIQTMHFRVERADGRWVWLHTRGKVVFKNSKKYSIVFTHCPVREEDSTYIQQEIVLRQRHVFRDLLQVMQEPITMATCNQQQLHYRHLPAGYPNQQNDTCYQQQQTPANQCPSSWHSQTECHSPVFPAPNMPSKAMTSCRESPDRKYRRMEYPMHQKEANYVNNGQSNEQYCQWEQQPYMSPCMYSEYPMGYGYSDNNVVCHPCRQDRVPLARQYLMQLNGLGMGPQMSPTTLVFQGQLTAIQTTENAFPFSPHWSHFASNPNSYPPTATSEYCCGTSRTSGPPSCQFVNCESTTPSCANDSLQQISELVAETGQKEAADVKPAISHPPSCKMDARSTSSTCAVNSLPSCIYQSSNCRVACKMVDLNRYSNKCMMEVPASEKKGNVELPAIGSFLEYLNDVA